MSHGLPPDASLDGHRVDALLHYAHGWDFALMGLLVVWVVFACLRFRRGSRAAAFRGDSPGAWVLVVGVALAVFLGADGVLYARTIRDLDQTFWNFKKPIADPSTVRLEINAQQWAWDARYAGPDGHFNTQDDVVTLNDIRIPLGRPILIQLASADVVHNFSLPNFRIKMDAVPGQLGRMWFQAEKTGQYEILCQQHCGVHHYKMRGLLTVLPGDAYDAWAREASTLSARGYDIQDSAAHWGWAWKDLP